MNIMRRIWDRLTKPQQPAGERWFVHGVPSSGIHVSPDTALTYSAVWACIRAISDPIAAMPWQVMQRQGITAKWMENHPADWLLRVAPNPEMSAYQFRECLVSWALTWGNGYAEIERSGSGSPVNLWLIAPDRVQATRDSSGNLFYEISNSGGRATIPARDIFHLRGPGWDGVSGYSPIMLAKEAIGLGLATERFGAAFFGNGAMPGGIIEAPPELELSPEARKLMLGEFNKVHRGAGSFGKVAFLDGGMKYHPLSVPPETAQFLETRQFQAIEICRWFRVPPHKIFEMGRATYANIGHQQMEFLQETLDPWIVRLEQEADAKLLGPYQRGKAYTQLKSEAFLRLDIKSRFDAYKVGREGGWLSVNEIRELEGMNPVENGDIYLQSGSFREAGSEPEPAPVAIPEPPTPEPTESMETVTDLLKRLIDKPAPAQHYHAAPMTANIATPPVTVKPAAISVHIDAPPAPDVRIDAPVTIAQPAIAVHVDAAPAPDVRIDAPVTIEAPAPTQHDIVIHNHQTAPDVTVYPPDVQITAPPAPDVVVQIGDIAP